MSLTTFDLTEQYTGRFLTQLPTLPQGKYVSAVVIRETLSHCIFTTEGGEQGQDTERVRAGLSDGAAMDRLVLFKRKQVAAERRIGKAHLRSYGAFPLAVHKKGNVVTAVFGQEEIDRVKAAAKDKEGEKVEEFSNCHLIDGLCGHCPDCLLYGYAAVEGQGARKARVLTDSAFSVRPYEVVQEWKKFNVIDEETMTSGTITEFDHTRPQTFFPCVETCVDVTADEFVYVLGNLLKTSRYGKEGTRIGHVRNHLVAIAFSDVELFANLEFTQAFHDAFANPESGAKLPEGPLSFEDFQHHLTEVLETLLERVYSPVTVVLDEKHTPKEGPQRVTWAGGLETFRKQLADFWADEGKVKTFLIGLTKQAAEFAARAPQS